MISEGTAKYTIPVIAGFLANIGAADYLLHKDTPKLTDDIDKVFKAIVTTAKADPNLLWLHGISIRTLACNSYNKGAGSSITAAIVGLGAFLLTQQAISLFFSNK